MSAEVVQMPDRPGGYVTLRHEAIDDFTDWEQGFMELERIAKLPRETAFHFGKAHRAGKATARSDSSHTEKQP